MGLQGGVSGWLSCKEVGEDKGEWQVGGAGRRWVGLQGAVAG